MVPPCFTSIQSVLSICVRTTLVCRHSQCVSQYDYEKRQGQRIRHVGQCLISVCRGHLPGEGRHASCGVQGSGDRPQPLLHCGPRHSHPLWGGAHQTRGTGTYSVPALLQISIEQQVSVTTSSVGSCAWEQVNIKAGVFRDGIFLDYSGIPDFSDRRKQFLTFECYL